MSPPGVERGSTDCEKATGPHRPDVRPQGSGAGPPGQGRPQRGIGFLRIFRVSTGVRSSKNVHIEATESHMETGELMRKVWR